MLKNLLLACILAACSTTALASVTAHHAPDTKRNPLMSVRPMGWTMGNWRSWRQTVNVPWPPPRPIVVPEPPKWPRYCYDLKHFCGHPRR
jgi:hypothetical protein